MTEGLGQGGSWGGQPVLSALLSLSAAHCGSASSSEPSMTGTCPGQAADPKARDHWGLCKEKPQESPARGLGTPEVQRG